MSGIDYIFRLFYEEKFPFISFSPLSNQLHKLVLIDSHRIYSMIFIALKLLVKVTFYELENIVLQKQ